MTSAINRWKLGLFVVIVLGAAIVAVISVGEATTHHATVTFVTYFDESVGGLDSGARVEFRGVQVGTVDRLSIAPDHRHVEVAYDLDLDSLARIGITRIEQDHVERYQVPPELRAQIGGNGLTGVRNVSLDLFDPQENSPPVLPFAVPSNSIPAATSTMKGLEDALTKASIEVPKVVGAVVKASNRVDEVLAELQRNHVSDKTASALEHVDAALVTFDATMRRFDRERVPQKTSQALGDASVALAKMDRVLDRLDGERGLIATDLDQALDELRDTAEAIRLLAEDLDRDPDMLLKGRPTRGGSR
jgi:ABC-type transporter Mla subunit MlaD